MYFSLTGALLAFCTGAVGASIGGIQAFVFTGFVGLAGLGLLATGVATVIGDIAFGFWFHPALAFFASVVACAYAKNRGLIGSGKDIAVPLISTRRIDVILVGALAGLAGWATQGLLVSGQGLAIKADGGAITIFILSLITKLIFDKTLVGKVPEDIKAKGGRFSTKHDNCWHPVQRSMGMKFLMGLFWGAAGAFAAYMMIKAGAAIESAPLVTMGFFITFFISAVSLFFLIGGFNIPITHHITLPAGYAVYNLLVPQAMLADGTIDFVKLQGLTDSALIPTDLLLWGIAIGVTGAILADFMSDIFHVYGDVHIDPPAMAICITSLFCMYVLGAPDGGMASNVVIPVILIIIGLVLAIMNPGIKENPGNKAVA